MNNRLLEKVLKLARKKADGHLSILYFTTHVKVMLGTPCLDNGSGREQVRNLEGYETLEEALKAVLELSWS